jgi:nitronate monooxygenase
MFGLEFPLMSAPMAMHSGGRLAAAVSKAGALGSFGGIHRSGDANWVRGEVERIRAETDRPFGIGFITNFIPMLTPLFDAAVEAKPTVIAFSFGSPGAYAEKAKASGLKVMCQVQSLTHAREAIAAGADILVAQGNEAGGHTGTMNLLPLLVSVLDAFPDTPVLASGGISTGRALAAVLAAGADGAWAGTAFLATPECVEIPEEHKQTIVRSDGEDTIFTLAYDVLFGMPWPEGIGERVQRNKFTDEWHGREDEVAKRREELAPKVQAGEGDFNSGLRAILYGQGAGAISAVRPAAQVVRTICDDAERILRERSGELIR